MPKAAALEEKQFAHVFKYGDTISKTKGHHAGEHLKELEVMLVRAEMEARRNACRARNPQQRFSTLSKMPIMAYSLLLSLRQTPRPLLCTMKGALVVGDLMAGVNDGRLSEAERRLTQIWRRLEMCRSITVPLEKLALPQLEETVQETLEVYEDLVQSNQHMLGSGIFAGLRGLS
ncbi:hypothetical protein CONLIGDRAFT_684940 [Coniochaeta ligniaria NRRL 30616]|uniref:Uncharacterized protein n=1 Tax=Coniochaeta ligniaria NRRL 30616 TaxID=1408157 RepID=A0A1J7J7D3_9PEZI|nr:hypothetical protein CONLIGDRAFT_684940 [Coniochaeta ligniaria NRRL 30616]